MNLLRQMLCYALSLLLFVACNQSRHIVSNPPKLPNREDQRSKELKIATLNEVARSLIGKPYQLGNSGPKAYDCSGFTCKVFQAIKMNLPRKAADQSTMGVVVKLESTSVGDLLFFGTNTIDHVSLVTKVKAGKIYVTHATSSSGVVEQILQDSDYWMKRLKQIRRVIL